MKQSQLLIPTLREAPADAELISHQLMVRAGYIRKLASGVYTYLPLALRVLQKLEAIIREEMAAEGAQELLLPVVMPAELWQETGRWDFYGKELLRFQDRHERDFCVGPTHEEAITDLVRHTVSSYRDLPMNLFQIQTKFRDEIRPRFGLMRGREFIMKDGYSFDVDEAAALVTYDKMYRAYTKIFERCGLKFRPVEAMTGAIGGSQSHEFQVLAESGEDPILASSTTDYAANVEKAPLEATVDLKQVKKLAGHFKVLETPGKKSVEEVAKFLAKSPQDFAKTLIFSTEKGLIAALVRGDHELMPAKLQRVAGVSQLEIASASQIKEALKSEAGYVGPVGLTIPIYLDYALAEKSAWITGANEVDKHLEQVGLGDFQYEGFFDLRLAKAGDPCPAGGIYEAYRGIEVGQVFFLGTKYSEAMGATYKNEKAQDTPMVMGCYGIGVSRTAAAAIEQNHDESGIIWPYSLAPFHFHLISLNTKDKEVLEFSERLYQQMQGAGLEVLWDERDLNPGVKFKDSDLIGIPYRVVVGQRGLKKNLLELKSRATGQVQELPLEDVLAFLQNLHQGKEAF